jgi:hypothetical protein
MLRLLFCQSADEKSTGPSRIKDRQGRRSCVGPNGRGRGQVMAHLRPTGRAGRPERARARAPGPRDRRMVRPRRPRRSPDGNPHRPTATSLLRLRSRRAWGRSQVPWTPGVARRVGAGRGGGGSTCRRRTLPAMLPGVEYIHTGWRAYVVLGGCGAPRRAPATGRPAGRPDR